MTRILSALFLLLFLQPAMAQRKYNKTTTDPLQMYMVMVPGGSFDLGSNDEADDRKPAHTVRLKDYYIGTYEVTQRQWKKVMGTNPSKFVCEDCAVQNVNYADVQSFIEKLNATTGKHYRLPTEAEWEYAARGGNREELVISNPNTRKGMDGDSKRIPDRMTSGKRYAGQKQPGEVAWFKRNSEDHVHRIGIKKPNELGIYDMSGNVEEWCSDFYGTTYGSKNTADNPQGPSGGTAHVVRGGSYESDPDELVVTRRAGYVPATKSLSLGFRLAEDK